MQAARRRLAFDGGHSVFQNTDIFVRCKAILKITADFAFNSPDYIDASLASSVNARYIVCNNCTSTCSPAYCISRLARRRYEYKVGYFTRSCVQFRSNFPKVLLM